MEAPVRDLIPASDRRYADTTRFRHRHADDRRPAARFGGDELARRRHVAGRFRFRGKRPHRIARDVVAAPDCRWPKSTSRACAPSCFSASALGASGGRAAAGAATATAVGAGAGGSAGATTRGVVTWAGLAVTWTVAGSVAGGAGL